MQPFTEALLSKPAAIVAACETWQRVPKPARTAEWYDQQGPSFIQQGGTVAAHIQRAQSYYWREAIADRLWHSSRAVPDDTVLCRRDAPAEYGWYWFPCPVTMSDDSEDRVSGISWGFGRGESGAPMVTVTAFTGTCDKLLTLNWCNLEEQQPLIGTTWITRLPENAPFHLGLAKFLIATWAWCRQGWIGASRQLPERKDQARIAARVKCAKQETGVNIIVLRRAEPKKYPRHDTPLHQQDHRWWVSEHYRNQYFPSEDVNRLICIETHVKGPADKPLQPPREHLYAVTR